MAIDLAKLVVRLEADSARLQSQLEKSENRARKWESKVKGSVSSVKKTFIALGSVATVGLFTRLVKDSIAAADRIGKVSDAVALTTSEYQKLAFAADIGGVAQSQFNSNMTAFVKRVGEARANTGPLVSFLQKYDEVLLQAIKNTKNQADAFDLIANAIKNAKSETDQAAIANAAFSRAGVGMVNVMRGGAKGLDEMRAKAERLGIVLDENTVRNAEKANDQLTIMATVIKNNVIKQVVALSPQIIAIGEAFANALPKITLFIEKMSGTESVGTLTEKLAELNVQAARTFSQLEQSNKSGDSFLTRYMFGTKEELQARLEERYQAIAEIAARISELSIATSGPASPTVGAKQAETAALISLEIDHAESLRKLYEKEAAERIKREQQVQDQITTMRGNAWQSAAGFLRLYAGESKEAAIAVIAIEKGLAIAQILQNKAVAITAALKLPPGISAARIAQIETISAVQIGLVAATGLVQASQVGGGGAGAGTYANPTYTQTPADSNATDQGNQQGGITYVNIDGYGVSEEGIDALIEQIRDATERRDKIIISRNSRNRDELVA